MVAAVCLGNVPVRVVQLPLAPAWAGIIAGSRLRVHAELGHQAALNVVVVKVAADTELRHLKLSRAEDLARSRNGIVLWFVETVGKVPVDPKFSCKCLGFER